MTYRRLPFDYPQLVWRGTLSSWPQHQFAALGVRYVVFELLPMVCDRITLQEVHDTKLAPEGGPISTPLTVVGIDVGGPKKGFHAVALSDGSDLVKFAVLEAKSMADWCSELNAAVIGIDAPCRWSISGRARSAERELAADGVHAFATPTRQVAESSKFYRWMLNGAELYAQLETTHRLFDGHTCGNGHICFETFPHAVACSLSREIVSAKQKRTVRRTLLRNAAIDTTILTNIDFIDAALCALAAKYLLAKDIRTYGDAIEGFIVVPN